MKDIGAIYREWNNGDVSFVFRCGHCGAEARYQDDFPKPLECPSCGKAAETSATTKPKDLMAPVDDEARYRPGDDESLSPLAINSPSDPTADEREP